MAVTVVSAAGTNDKGNKVSRWSSDVAREYIKNEEFSPWSGRDPGKVFRYKEELTKERGEDITFSLVGKLSGDPVVDDDTLEGAEEALDNFAWTVTIHQYRIAVIRGEHEQRKTLIEILDEAKFMLKERAMELLRDAKIAALTSPHLDGITTYASATEAEKDAWLTANTDRVQFGVLLSNQSATFDHSASLLNVDTTSDTLNRSVLSLAKREAENADPLIRPIKINGIRQHFVAFCGTLPHRDLKADLDTIHASAAPREKGMTNPIFVDDDLVYEDVVVRKVPAMATLGAVGAASAPIYLVAFCGAEAVGVAWGAHLHAIRNGPEGQDYGNKKGVGIAETRGVAKTFFDSNQHGLYTIYVAAEADA